MQIVLINALIGITVAKIIIYIWTGEELSLSGVVAVAKERFAFEVCSIVSLIKSIDVPVEVILEEIDASTISLDTSVVVVKIVSDVAEVCS